MPVSAEEHLNDISISSRGILDADGITMASLVRLIKGELRAKETKFIKIKGVMPCDEDGNPKVSRGVRVIATTDDETVIAVTVAALGIRQAARKDVHMLRGDYPDGKLTLSGDIFVNTGIKREGDGDG